MNPPSDSVSHLPRRANRTVDWKAVRAHLERVAAASDPAHASADDAPVLGARAAALARARTAVEARPRGQLHLVVRLGDERYALDARLAGSVLTLRDCVPLPGLPAHIRGLINVRSRIFPAVDLKAFWRLPSPGGAEQVALLSVDETEFALVVDEVLETVPLDLDELQPLPAEAGLRARHLRGLLAGLLVLDLPKLLPELVVDHSRSFALPTP